MVSKDLYDGLCKKKQRGTALKWNTICNKLRAKMREEKAAAKAAEAAGEEDSYHTDNEQYILTMCTRLLWWFVHIIDRSQQSY